MVFLGKHLDLLAIYLCVVLRVVGQRVGVDDHVLDVERLERAAFGVDGHLFNVVEHVEAVNDLAKDRVPASQTA